MSNMTPEQKSEQPSKSDQVMVNLANVAANKTKESLPSATRQPMRVQISLADLEKALAEKEEQKEEKKPASQPMRVTVSLADLEKKEEKAKKPRNVAANLLASGGLGIKTAKEKQEFKPVREKEAQDQRDAEKKIADEKKDLSDEFWGKWQELKLVYGQNAFGHASDADTRDLLRSSGVNFDQSEIRNFLYSRGKDQFDVGTDNQGRLTFSYDLGIGKREKKRIRIAGHVEKNAVVVMHIGPGAKQ